MKYGIPLIFDEVATGFRLAYGGAQEYYGVTPDLCAMGKIMGGGYPLAAVLGRKEIMSVYDQRVSDAETWVNQMGTLNGNPIACAAGLATLEELRKEGTYPRLRAIGGRLRQALADVCSQNGIPVQPGGEDVMFDVFFTGQRVIDYRSSLTSDPKMHAGFNGGLLEHSILKGWPQKFYPSLAHTDADIERTIEVFKAVVPMLRGC